MYQTQGKISLKYQTYSWKQDPVIKCMQKSNFSVSNRQENWFLEDSYL